MARRRSSHSNTRALGRRTPILTVASVEGKIRQAWSMPRRCRRVPALRSSFAGFRFPPDVITLAVRWYLRYGLSYRDVEELLAERCIAVDHVSVYRWVQRFTLLLIDAARPCRHAPGDRCSSMKHTSEFLGDGSICIGRSTSSARSSTYLWPRTGSSGYPPVLHPGARARFITDRGDHRPRADLPAGGR